MERLRQGAGERRAALEELGSVASGLTEELKRIREGATGSGGATMQQQSFEGGGGLGNLIHRASLGGLGASGQGGRALGGGAGISVPDGGRSTALGRSTDLGDGLHGRPFGTMLRGGLGPPALPVGKGTGVGHTATKEERAAYIRETARRNGIDPDTALRVAQSEGFNKYSGDQNTSFGDWQFHYKNNIPGLSNPGMGDDFTRETGLDARDPSTWKAQTDFAMKRAASEGWGAWHGARRAGIGNRDGIGGREGVRLAQADGGIPAPTDEARMGLTGNAATGRSPIEPVDPRLTNVLREASRYLPEGYRAAFQSGYRPGDPRFHGRRMAEDVAIFDAQGRKLENYQSEGPFRLYEQYAQAVKKIQMDRYPELGQAFRWGGYFSGGRDRYGAVDTMHFDIGGERVGMGGGTWEHGLSDAQRERFPGARSEGMGDLSRYRLPEPYRLRGPINRRDQDGGQRFADAYRARQAEADAEHEGLGLTGGRQSAVDRALRSGVIGATPNADAMNNRLDLHILHPGENTRVAAKARGPIFREIKQSRGRQMAGAGED